MDLDCFDTYEMCSKIAEMPIPVITGIGHERDETIADLVAHSSLKTPTAVSEFLINGVGQFEVGLDECLVSIRNMANSLDNLDNRLKSSIKTGMNKKQMHLESLKTKLSLLDPEQVLKRGYTITSLNNKFISKAGKVVKGDKIRTYSDKLIIDSTIEKSEPR